MIQNRLKLTYITNKIINNRLILKRLFQFILHPISQDRVLLCNINISRSSCRSFLFFNYIVAYHFLLLLISNKEVIIQVSNYILSISARLFLWLNNFSLFTSFFYVVHCFSFRNSSYFLICS